MGDRKISAPANRRFGLGLVADVNGDGQPDLLAATEQQNGARLDVRLFGARGAEATLYSLPAALDIENCTHSVELSAISERLVLLRVPITCGPEQAKQLQLAVIRYDPARAHGTPRPPELALDLLLTGHPEIHTEVRDHDGDRHEDLILGLATVPAGPRAILIFLDRPAGYAQDRAEPSRSLRQHAERLAQAEPKETELFALLELARAVCPQHAVRSPQATISCETKVGEELTLAWGRAAVLRGDLWRARAAQDLLPEKSSSALRLAAALNGKLKRFELLIEKTIPSVAQAELLPPVAFDGQGNLLVDTPRGVRQIDAATLVESASVGVSWPRLVAFRSGDATVELVGASLGCAPARHEVLSKARGTETRVRLPSELPLLRELSTGECKPRVMPLSVLSASPKQGAHLAVAGELFALRFTTDGLVAEAIREAADLEIPPPGAARSADGKRLVLPYRGELLWHQEGAWESWANPSLSGLQRCVPSPVARRAACQTAEGAIVLVAPRTL